MIILRDTGGRLKRRATVSLTVMIVFAVALVVLAETTNPNLPIAVNWGIYTNFYVAFIVLLTFGVIHFFREYRHYKQGFEGENRVTKYLSSSFGSDHFLINDLVYNNNGHKANIDHVVLAPNGIFAIETKDYRGKITAKESYWTVPFPYGRSPSKQAQGNAVWVKNNVDGSGILLNINLWVEPIVVFSNPEVELDRIDPEVAVVYLKELADCIQSYNRGYNFQSAQLRAIGKELLEKASQDK